MKLYYALIYPFLTYGILIWENAYETTLKPVLFRINGSESSLAYADAVVYCFLAHIPELRIRLANHRRI